MTYFGKKGKQEQARYDRLINEILSYVTDNPRVTAADITGYLCVKKKMKNHGLTPRKVGMFIPRHCKEDIKWVTDRGARVYSARKHHKSSNSETLDDRVEAV